MNVKFHCCPVNPLTPTLSLRERGINPSNSFSLRERGINRSNSFSLREKARMRG
jgi:hypothetical protein